jgi:hypothetical protein
LVYIDKIDAIRKDERNTHRLYPKRNLSQGH